MSRLKALVILGLLLSSCAGRDAAGPDDPAPPPREDPSKEEQARRERMALGAKILVSGQVVAAWDLRARVIARDVVLQDCFDELGAKPGGLPYQPDKRVMLKVKHERSADVVVAGSRLHKSGPVVGSLLLGLYDTQGGTPETTIQMPSERNWL